jgi:hypothetical protein
LLLLCESTVDMDSTDVDNGDNRKDDPGNPEEDDKKPASEAPTSRPQSKIQSVDSPVVSPALSDTLFPSTGGIPHKPNHPRESDTAHPSSTVSAESKGITDSASKETPSSAVGTVESETLKDSSKMAGNQTTQIGAHPDPVTAIERTIVVTASDEPSQTASSQPLSGAAGSSNGSDQNRKQTSITPSTKLKMEDAGGDKTHPTGKFGTADAAPLSEPPVNSENINHDESGNFFAELFCVVIVDFMFS